MKAPPNDTCSIYAGPLTASPGALLYADVACRIVPDMVFREVDTPFSDIVAYLTIVYGEGLILGGPNWTKVENGEWKAEWGYADRIVLDSVSELTFLAARIEHAIPVVGPAYYRVHLSLDRELFEPEEGGGGGGGDVGSDLYYASPWGLLLFRTSETTWADVTDDTILSTDGEGSWECIDVADDIHYDTSGWDGTGTRRLFRDGDPESSEWVDMQQGE